VFLAHRSDVRSEDETETRKKIGWQGAFAAAAAYSVKPAFGASYPTVLAIADQAPHPNAAKLLIHYMVDEGLKYWNVIGDYAARSDVAAEQVALFHILPFEKAALWPIDQTYVYDTKYSFVSFFLALR